MTHRPEIRKAIDPDAKLVKAVQAGRFDLLPLLVERYEKALFRIHLKVRLKFFPISRGDSLIGRWPSSTAPSLI